MGNQSSNSGKGKLFPECIVPRLSNYTGHHDLINTTATSPRFLCRPTAYLELAVAVGQQRQQEDVNSRRTAEESRTTLPLALSLTLPLLALHLPISFWIVLISLTFGQPSVLCNILFNSRKFISQLSVSGIK